MENLKLVEVSPLGEKTICVDGVGKVVAWDDGKNAWQPQAQADMREDEEMAIGIVMYMDTLREDSMRMPPILDPQSQIVMMGMAPIINPLARDHQDCIVAPLDDLNFEKIGKLPRDAMRLFAAKDGPIAVTSSGRFFPTQVATACSNCVHCRQSHQDDRV